MACSSSPTACRARSVLTFLYRGANTQIVITGLLTGVASYALLADESPHNRVLRDYYRKAPLLGFGLGYASCRMWPLPWQSSFVGGLAGAALVWALWHGPHPRKPDGEEADYQVPSYQIMDASGGPPGAAPAAHEPTLMI